MTKTISIQNNDFVHRCSLAKCQDTPPQELDILARDKDPIVRRLVAGNYSTLPETLDYLSYDTDEDVIKGIANNPVAWATTLERLRRPDKINRDMLFSLIISNPYISPDKLSSITKITIV
jgi:hypothetical protein